MGNQGSAIPWDANSKWQVQDATGTIPPPAECVAYAVDEKTSVLYICGGVNDQDDTPPPEEGEGEEDVDIAPLRESEMKVSNPAASVYALQRKGSALQWDCVFDASSKQVAHAPPGALSGAVGAVLADPQGNSALYVFGGLDPHRGYSNSTFKFDLTAKEWKELAQKGSPPDPRDKMSFATHAASNCLYVFGGFGPKEEEPSLSDGEEAMKEEDEATATFGWFNDLHKFDGERWTAIPTSGTVPTARAAGAMAFGCNGSSLFVFGGRDSAQRQNDLYQLDMTSLVWTKLNPAGIAPPPRSYHTLTPLDSAGSRLMVFGGLSQTSQHLNNVIVYDTEQSAWVSPVLEGRVCFGRGSHLAIPFNAYSGENEGSCKAVLVYGGSSEFDEAIGGPSAYHNDIWILNAEPLLSTAITIPPPEESAASVREKPSGDETHNDDDDGPPPLTNS